MRGLPGLVRAWAARSGTW